MKLDVDFSENELHALDRCIGDWLLEQGVEACGVEVDDIELYATHGWNDYRVFYSYENVATGRDVTTEDYFRFRLFTNHDDQAVCEDFQHSVLP